jgi:hypothetical protein
MNKTEFGIATIFSIVLITIGLFTISTYEVVENIRSTSIDSLKTEIIKRDSVIKDWENYTYRVRKMFNVPDSLPIHDSIKKRM